MTPPGVGQHSPCKFDSAQTGFKLHCDESGPLVGTSDGTVDGTTDSAMIFNVGDNEGDEVGVSDANSVGSSVGTIVLVGTVVGTSPTNNVGELVGNSVVGWVVLTLMGAKEGAIIGLVIAAVGVVGKTFPSAHVSVKSCKCGLMVPF